MYAVTEWADIADNYKDTLVLGNGASIAVDPRFAYGSLLQVARERGRLTSALEKIFRYLETQDFELVLSMLWHAHHINQALGTTEDNTVAAYRDIRDALIGTIRDHHTDYATARPHLEPIWSFMKHFRTVASLNYDLIVYWAMMAAREHIGNWFKDGFVDQAFAENWKQLREAYQAAGATLVVYPHGNLAIGSKLPDVETKLVRGTSADLLEKVLESWQDGKVTPLFVAEGTSSQKLGAIFRSRYLGMVYQEVLRDAGASVAVYGWAAKLNDSHITRRLIDGGVSRFAFAVQTNGRTKLEVQKKCKELADGVLAFDKHMQLDFYRAESSGCWINV